MRQSLARRLRVARCATAWLVAVGGLALSAAAGSMQTGKTAQGHEFTTGGISTEELTSLHAGRAKYNLWVVTAAMGSGAHLADVRVVIRGPNGKPAFEGNLHGPWLFINLPLGRYEIEASIGNETHKSVTTIHKGDLHQAFFYFATGDQLSPGNRSPFPGNPYAQKKP